MSDAVACNAEVKAVCGKRDACSSNGFLNAKIYGSEALCESLTLPVCENDLKATGTAQTPAGVEACVAAYPTYTCTNFYDDDPPTACVPPAGTSTTGAGCGVDAQCASAFCAIGEYALCGTCQPLPTVGTPCTDAAECGRDLACASTPGTCAAWVPNGGTCLTNTNPCQNGFSCVGDDPAKKTTGTCKPAANSVNAACDTARKTLPSCDTNLGLACVPTASDAGAASTVGTCQEIALVAAGKPCGNLGGTSTSAFTSVADCEAGGLCKKAAATDPTGTCVAPAKNGDACDSNALIGPPCLAPARCVPTADGGTAGTCTVPDATKCP